MIMWANDQHKVDDLTELCLLLQTAVCTRASCTCRVSAGMMAVNRCVSAPVPRKGSTPVPPGRCSQSHFLSSVEPAVNWMYWGVRDGRSDPHVP